MNDELRKKYPGLDDEQIAQNERAMASFQKQSKQLPEEAGLEEPVIDPLDFISPAGAISKFGKLRGVLGFGAKQGLQGAERKVARTGAQMMEEAAVDAVPGSWADQIRKKALKTVDTSPKSTFTKDVIVKPEIGIKETFTGPIKIKEGIQEGIADLPRQSSLQGAQDIASLARTARMQKQGIGGLEQADEIGSKMIQMQQQDAIGKLSKIDAAKKAAEIKEKEGPEAARKFANIWKTLQNQNSQGEGE